METTETTTVLTPLEKRIAKLRADAEAKLNREIAEIENEEKANEARKDLERKIKALIREFEFTFNVKYKLDDTPPESNEQKKLTVQEKCEIVEKELIDGKPKYKLSDDGKAIIGAKGEPIRTVIKFDDASNNPQTLGVTSYYKYLKPDTTKEEIEKLFPKKNIVIDKLRDGILTEK